MRTVGAKAGVGRYVACGYVSERNERSQQFLERHSYCAGLSSCSERQRSSYHSRLEETRQRLEGNGSAGCRSQTFESEGRQCFPVTCFHIIFKVTQTGVTSWRRLLAEARDFERYRDVTTVCGREV